MARGVWRVEVPGGAGEGVLVVSGSELVHSSLCGGPVFVSNSSSVACVNTQVHLHEWALLVPTYRIYTHTHTHTR